MVEESVDGEETEAKESADGDDVELLGSDVSTIQEEPETLGEDATAFRYVIPLEEEDGVLKPVYDINYQGHVLEKRYRSDDYVVVQTEGLGYLHQDSVAATYEEVPVSDYTDPTELEKDVDYKNHV